MRWALTQRLASVSREYARMFGTSAKKDALEHRAQPASIATEVA